jgi:hypothetical protein
MGRRSQSPLSTASLRRLSWKVFFRYRKLPLQQVRKYHIEGIFPQGLNNSRLYAIIMRLKATKK